MIYVYKVAKAHAALPDTFTSVSMRGSAALNYKLGEMTVSDTPIFVFKEKSFAQSYNLHDFDTVLLGGYSATEPIAMPILSQQVLHAYWPYSKDEIRLFWKRVQQKELEHFLGQYKLASYPMQTYIVYDFTPTAIITEKY